LAGEIIQASDVISDAAWTTYAPVWTQGATVITKTTARAVYVKTGRLVVMAVDLTATGAGTAGAALGVTLPFTAASGGVVGTCFFSDSGVGFYIGAAVLASVTVCGFYTGGAVTSAMGVAGGGFVAAIAAGDRLIFSATYEASS
jgi:hypothetical protein